MKTYEALEAVLGKIEDPRNWCQSARMEGDRRCALGAFDDVLFEHEDRATFAALHQGLEGGKRQLGALAMSRMGMPPGNDWEQAIAGFNDTRSHGEVVKLFKTAIRAGKGNEASKGTFFAVPIKAPYAIATKPSPDKAWTTYEWTTAGFSASEPVPIPMAHAYEQAVLAQVIQYDEAAVLA